MIRIVFLLSAILAFIQFILCILISPPSLAQEWEVRVKPRGTVRVVDLWVPFISVMLNYVEGLVTLDKDSNWVPCLSEDWRWIDDRTVEFKLREGVRLHNGEKFKVNFIRLLDTLKAAESRFAKVVKIRVCSASV